MKENNFKEKKHPKKEMDLEKIKKEIEKNKQALKENYKIKEISVFGSYAKKRETKKSDIDILVKFEKGATLLDLTGAGQFLEEKLKTKVDIVSERGLRPELRESILRERVKI